MAELTLFLLDEGHPSTSHRKAFKMCLWLLKKEKK